MTFKNFLKNILPHFIVSRYNNKRPQPAGYLKYLEKGDAVLHPNFYITVLKPEARKYVTVGNNTMLDCRIVFESNTGEVIIGNNVFIGASTIICKSRIEFGNNIFVAWGTYFYDHDSHSLDYKERQKDILQQLQDHRNGDNFILNKNWDVINTAPITIADNAWIGMNALILKGVSIGEGAIVAAGSVVTKDVASWTMVAGNPAREVKKL